MRKDWKGFPVEINLDKSNVFFSGFAFGSSENPHLDRLTICIYDSESGKDIGVVKITREQWNEFVKTGKSLLTGVGDATRA